MAEAVHVYPLGDLREHVIDGTPCWCAPETLDEPSGFVIVHRALDGREAYESGERKPS